MCEEFLYWPHWVRNPAQWKGESEMNRSIHFPLLLDCGTNGQPSHAPAAIPSPTMDRALKLNQNKPFLKFSVSYFVFLSHEVASTHTKSSVLHQSAQAHHQWSLPLEALRSRFEQLDGGLCWELMGTNSSALCVQNRPKCSLLHWFIHRERHRNHLLNGICGKEGEWETNTSMCLRGFTWIDILHTQDNVVKWVTWPDFGGYEAELKLESWIDWIHSIFCPLHFAKDDKVAPRRAGSGGH